jgi:hypothetical protein
MLTKWPCCICRRWFVPDRRVGHRQRVFGNGMSDRSPRADASLLIGRQLEVRETKDRLDVYLGPGSSPRMPRSSSAPSRASRCLCTGHRVARPSTQPLPEEQTLAQAEAPVPAYAAALKQRSGSRHTRFAPVVALDRESPRGSFLQAVTLSRRSQRSRTRNWRMPRNISFPMAPSLPDSYARNTIIDKKRPSPGEGESK